jgi:thymidylate synthase (FAD)
VTTLRLVTEPDVYVISRPWLSPNAGCHATIRGDDKGVTLDAENDADNLCEFAGRVCYDSFAKPRPGGNDAYLQHIKESGHGSVLEHANWTLLLTGVSRSLTHELVRHRAGFAYSMESQRYVDESDVAFVVPLALLHAVSEAEGCIGWMDGYISTSHATPNEAAAAYYQNHRDTKPATVNAGMEWRQACAQSLAAYRELTEYLIDEAPADLPPTDRRKHARQAARSVLPNCCETRIVVTANARAWRTFLEQRGSRGAEPEIRRLANRVLAVLHSEAPNLFSDYTATALPDGTAEITTPHRKV